MVFLSLFGLNFGHVLANFQFGVGLILGLVFELVFGPCIGKFSGWCLASVWTGVLIIVQVGVWTGVLTIVQADVWTGVKATF